MEPSDKGLDATFYESFRICRRPRHELLMPFDQVDQVVYQGWPWIGTRPCMVKRYHSQSMLSWASWGSDQRRWNSLLSRMTQTALEDRSACLFSASTYLLNPLPLLPITHTALYLMYNLKYLNSYRHLPINHDINAYKKMILSKRKFWFRRRTWSNFSGRRAAKEVASKTTLLKLIQMIMIMLMQRDPRAHHPFTLYHRGTHFRFERMYIRSIENSQMWTWNWIKV